MTDKTRVLMLSIWYPLSMSRYFERAFRRREKLVGDVEFKTTGPYTSSWIPWMGGMELPVKYAKSPDLPLPFPPNVGRVNFEFVQAQLGDWKPDLVLCADAGINWESKPQHGYVATIATDPHCLDYSHARRISDKLFNMQACYSEPKDIYLPYAMTTYLSMNRLETPLITKVVITSMAIGFGGVLRGSLFCFMRILF